MQEANRQSTPGQSPQNTQGLSTADKTRQAHEVDIRTGVRLTAPRERKFTRAMMTRKVLPRKPATRVCIESAVTVSRMGDAEKAMLLTRSMKQKQFIEGGVTATVLDDAEATAEEKATARTANDAEIVVAGTEQVIIKALHSIKKSLIPRRRMLVHRAEGREEA